MHCSDNAPVCGNIRLAEQLTLGDKSGADGPFEVAICDDNDCLALVGTVDIVGGHLFASGYRGENPFWIKMQKGFFRNGSCMYLEIF